MSRRVHSRRWILGAFGSAGAALLAACASPSAPTPSSAAPTPSTGSATAGPAKGGSAPSAGPVTLRLIERTIPYKVNYWNELGKKLTAKFPNVTLKVEAYPGGTAYNEKVLTLFTGGDMADLFWVVNSENYLLYAVKDLLTSLDANVKKDNFDLSPFLPNTVDVFRYKGTLQAIVESFHGGSYLVVFVKDMLDQAGIPNPIDRDLTLDDYTDMVKKLTKPSEGVFGAYWSVGSSETETVLTRSFGGDILTADGTKSLLLDPKSRQAFQYMSDRVNVDKTFIRPTDIPENDANRAFKSKKLATMMSGNWIIGQLRQVVGNDFAWDMFLMPKGPAGRKGELIASAYPIPKMAKQPDYAWEFIKLMSTKDESIARMKAGFSGGPRLDVLTSPIITSDPQMNRYWQDVINGHATGAPVPANARITELYDILNKDFDPVWLGKQSLDAVLPAVDKKVQELLAKPVP